MRRKAVVLTWARMIRALWMVSTSTAMMGTWEPDMGSQMTSSLATTRLVSMRIQSRE